MSVLAVDFEVQENIYRSVEWKFNEYEATSKSYVLKPIRNLIDFVTVTGQKSVEW